MATISSALFTIKSHLGEHVPDSVIEQLCREAGHKWRKRVLGPITTVHLFLLQLLAKVALCGLAHVSKLSVSAAAICKAKMRLPLRVMEELLNWTGRSSTEASFRWLDLRVWICDGTTSITPDTPQLAAQYGKARNQKTRRQVKGEKEVQCPGYPIVKMLILADLATGLIQKVIGLPHARGEQTVLSRMFKLLQPNDLLLGDRGLVSFAHVALMLGARLHALLRLPRYLVVHGRGNGLRRRAGKLGRQDLLVTWKRPGVRPRSWLSLPKWKQLPELLHLRQVAVCLHREGFRTQWVWVLTTLLDEKKYPASKVAELYQRRWQIEVDFRDLKRSLGMQQLSARTTKGVKKEILAFITLYNLVRRIMMQAAERQGVSPDRIGFRDAIRWLLWSQPDEDLPPLVVNPIRRRATEPRARKHGGYLFPVLNKPRAELRQPRAEVIMPKLQS